MGAVADLLARPAVRLLSGTAGLLAFAWVVAVLTTGGADFTILGLRITSSNPGRPLLAGCILLGHFTWARLRASNAVSIAEALEPLRLSPKRIALTTAIIVGAIGLLRGATTAAGPDPYGYVSQADLWAAGDLYIEQRWVAAVPWPNAEWTFSPLGYRPAIGRRVGTIVPTYPTGLPLAMMAAKRVGGQRGIFVVVPVAGVVCILAVYGIGRRLHSPAAGLIAALLLSTWPPFLFHLQLPMSDVPAAAAWSVAWYLVVRGGPAGALGAGLAVSAAILLRPNLVFLAAFVGASYLAQTLRDRCSARRLRDGALFATTAAIGPVCVAASNAVLYGAPTASGYGALNELMSPTHVLPNMANYAIWTSQTSSPIAMVGLLVLAFAGTRIWSHPHSRTVARLLALSVLALATFYALYFVYDHWTFLRFFLPAASFAAVGIGALAATWLNGRARLRAAAAFLAVTTIAVVQLRFVGVKQVMETGLRESCHSAMARAVRASTPPDSVVIALNHSGTLRYYGGRHTLRYDQLDREWLAPAVAWLTARENSVFALLQGDEIEDFSRKYGDHSAQQVADLSCDGDPVYALYDLSGPPRRLPVQAIPLTRISGRVPRAAPMARPPVWQPE